MKQYIALALVCILSLPPTVFSAPGQGQMLRELKTKRAMDRKPKLASDLAEMLEQDDQQSLTLGQMRQNRQALKTRPADLPVRLHRLTLPSTGVPAEEKQSFIVQVENTTPDIVLQERLAVLGARVSQKVSNTGLVVIEAPRAAIRQIAAELNQRQLARDCPRRRIRP